MTLIRDQGKLCVSITNLYFCPSKMPQLFVKACLKKITKFVDIDQDLIQLAIIVFILQTVKNAYL